MDTDIVLSKAEVKAFNEGNYVNISITEGIDLPNPTLLAICANLADSVPVVTEEYIEEFLDKFQESLLCYALVQKVLTGKYHVRLHNNDIEFSERSEEQVNKFQAQLQEMFNEVAV